MTVLTHFKFLKKVEPWLVIAMVAASLIIRSYQLGSLPRILNRDEAALAYNGYLLNQTGRDEWSRPWPLALESFGDYKLAGYPFLLAAIFQFLPLTDWVVRLPSAVAGSLLVFSSYLLARTLKFSSQWRLLLTLLVATTPVFFFYSRIAFEANLALWLMIAFLTSVFSQVDRARWWQDALAIGFYLIAVFTYNTPLLLLPMIVIIIPWLRAVAGKLNWWWLVIGLLIVGGVAGRQLLQLSSQKSGITIFQDETVWRQSIIYRQQFTGWSQRLLGNKYLYYGQLIAKNYLASLSPEFLVAGRHGHPWHTLPGYGHLLLTVYILAILGVIFISTELFLAVIHHQPLSTKLRIHSTLLYLLLVSPLPAVVTVDAPHATRSLLFMYLLVVMAVFGLKRLVTWLGQPFKRQLLIVLVLAIICAEFGQYLGSYWTAYARQQATFLPGFDQVMQQVDDQYPDQPVAIVDAPGFHYILLAWYLKLPPATFFETVIRQLADRIGFKYGQQLDHYHFIADDDDRVDTEKVLVKWAGNQWQVTEF